MADSSGTTIAIYRNRTYFVRLDVLSQRHPELMDETYSETGKPVVVCGISAQELERISKPSKAN